MFFVPFTWSSCKCPRPSIQTQNDQTIIHQHKQTHAIHKTIMEERTTFRRCEACSKCQPMFPKPVERSPMTPRAVTGLAEKHVCHKHHQEPGSLTGKHQSTTQATSTFDQAASAPGLTADRAASRSDSSSKNASKRAAGLWAPPTLPLRSNWIKAEAPNGKTRAADPIDLSSETVEQRQESGTNAAADPPRSSPPVASPLTDQDDCGIGQNVKLPVGMWTPPPPQHSEMNWLDLCTAKPSNSTSTTTPTAEPKPSSEMIKQIREWLAATESRKESSRASVGTQTENTPGFAKPGPIVEADTETKSNIAREQVSVFATEHRSRKSAPKRQPPKQGWHTLWSMDCQLKW
jgi:hypothetical protein